MNNGSRNHAFRFGSVDIPELSEASFLKWDLSSAGLQSPCDIYQMDRCFGSSMSVPFSQTGSLPLRSVNITHNCGFLCKSFGQVLNVFFDLPLTYMDSQCRTCHLRSCLTGRTGTRIRPWTSAVRLEPQGRAIERTASCQTAWPSESYSCQLSRLKAPETFLGMSSRQGKTA